MEVCNAEAKAHIFGLCLTKCDYHNKDCILNKLKELGKKELYEKIQSMNCSELGNILREHVVCLSTCDIAQRDRLAETAYGLLTEEKK